MPNVNNPTLARWLMPRNGVLLLLVILPFLLPSYWLFLATSILISSIAIASVGMLAGMAGQISLCQLSFAGVAAWVIAYLAANDSTLPFELQVLIGALVAVPVGVLIGLPALRLRGVNLAIVTLGFAFVTDMLFSIHDFPNSGLAKAIRRPGYLSSSNNYYWFCLLIAGIVLFTLYYLPRTRLGSSWLAVKHSERATAALGLSVPGTKLMAFAVSAFVAGISGGLLAGQSGLVSARNFAPAGSLVLFAVAVMVGARYPGGAILAGTLQWMIPEVLNRIGLPPDLGNLLFAAGTIQALSAGGGVFEQIARQRNVAQAERSSPTTSGETIETSPEISQPSTSTKPVLEVQGLTITYGNVMAVNAVDLTVNQGQIMGLIGPNGAGKSSFVDAVTGFMPYQGTVQLNRQPMDRLTATERARQGLRRTFQQDRTIPDLSAQIYLNLAAGRVLDEAELRLALDFAGVQDARLELHSLNMGTRRLLEVAGVLAAKPSVVLLDEPAAGLSVEETHLLGRHLSTIPTHYGCAVLLIEHDMELVHAACHEVTVIDFGQKIAIGPTQATLSQPEVIAAYLGEEVAI